MLTGDEPANQTEGFPAPSDRSDAVRNPAQVSFWPLEPAADAAMTYFYGQLFAMDTEIGAMFPAAMDVQRKRLFHALTRIIAGQDDREGLTRYREELGRAHRKFGVRERHYEIFRRAMLATMHRFAAHCWNEAARSGWETAFEHAAAIMIEAARRDAEDSPAWWIATVTEVERRGPDIAVLTAPNRNSPRLNNVRRISNRESVK